MIEIGGEDEESSKIYRRKAVIAGCDLRLLGRFEQYTFEECRAGLLSQNELNLDYACQSSEMVAHMCEQVSTILDGILSDISDRKVTECFVPAHLVEKSVDEDHNLQINDEDHEEAAETMEVESVGLELRYENLHKFEETLFGPTRKVYVRKHKEKKMKENEHRLRKMGHNIRFGSGLFAELKKEALLNSDSEWVRKHIQTLQKAPQLRQIQRQLSRNAGVGLGQVGTGSGSVRIILSDCDDDEGRLYEVKRLIGGGTFGEVYLAHIIDIDNVNSAEPARAVALKIQQPTNICEWSVQLAIQNRLTGTVHEKTRFLAFENYYAYDNAGYCIFPFYPLGSLAEAISRAELSRNPPDEQVVLVLAHELIRILMGLRFAGIIHADLKPDNILLHWRASPESETWKPSNGEWSEFHLVCIDFGRAVDTHSNFVKGKQLYGGRFTEGYACPEALSGSKPWLYQADAAAVAGMLHNLLLRRPMRIVLNKLTGRWTCEEPFRRYHDRGLWEAIFEALLHAGEMHEREYEVLLRMLQRKMAQVPSGAIRRAVREFVKNKR